MITGLIWVYVASLSGRTPQPQIITALRTVLFIVSPLWGDLCTSENWKVKRENWKVKIENWKVATFNHYSNLINSTRGEVPCGWGQILLFCEPEVCYLVDWYGVACLRHAWGWSLLPHTAHLRCLVWGYWDCVSSTRMGMFTFTPHCTPSVFNVGLLRLRIFDTLRDGHCYPTLHTFGV